MLLITKNEAKYLNKHGLQFGKSLIKSRSKHPHYFIVEESRALQKLNDYRESLKEKGG